MTPCRSRPLQPRWRGGSLPPSPLAASLSSPPALLPSRTVAIQGSTHRARCMAHLISSRGSAAAGGEDTRPLCISLRLAATGGTISPYGLACLRHGEIVRYTSLSLSLSGGSEVGAGNPRRVWAVAAAGLKERAFFFSFLFFRPQRACVCVCVRV